MAHVLIGIRESSLHADLPSPVNTNVSGGPIADTLNRCSARVFASDSIPADCNRRVTSQGPRLIDLYFLVIKASLALRDVVGNRSGRGKPWTKLPDNIKAMYRREAEATLRAGLALARDVA